MIRSLLDKRVWTTNLGETRVLNLELSLLLAWRAAGPHRGVTVWSPCARARLRPRGPRFSPPVGAGLSARPKPILFSVRDSVCLVVVRCGTVDWEA
jgi:hypothetical protein